MRSPLVSVRLRQAGVLKGEEGPDEEDDVSKDQKLDVCFSYIASNLGTNYDEVDEKSGEQVTV